MDLKEAAAIGSALTKLPERFVCAWWYAENGATWPADNNPGNVSYTGDGVPSGGVFEGVTEVLPNQVCVYDSPESGIRAWALTINTPVGLKYLDIDTAMLLGKTVKEQCQILGRSNWAESHYEVTDEQGVPEPHTWAGELIWLAYHNTVISAWYEVPVEHIEDHPAPKEEPTHDNHYPSVTVRDGDTLWRIALDHHIPMDVLARFNSLEHPAILYPGQTLRLPTRYRVRAGDTLDAIAARFGCDASFLAEVNRVNPNVIYSGQTLWV